MNCVLPNCKFVSKFGIFHLRVLILARLTGELTKAVKTDDKTVAEKLKSLNTNIETLLQVSVNY